MTRLVLKSRGAAAGPPPEPIAGGFGNPPRVLISIVLAVASLLAGPVVKRVLELTVRRALGRGQAAVSAPSRTAYPPQTIVAMS